MDEKIFIEFHAKDFHEIMKYMELINATTIQDAIMNAISIAFDEKDQ